MYIYFPCFSSLGVRAVSHCQGGTKPTLRPRGGFPTNLISPKTELRGGKGVGSSTVAAPETFESCISVTHMFLRGKIPCCRGAPGCRNCLKRLLARMSPCLRLAPTVPAGSQVARKYDPLLLRGNVIFSYIIICVLEASGTIGCVL